MSKTNTGLVAYARAQLGRPYWMGTFGQIASVAIYNYNKSRLPQYYTASDFPSQYGQRVHDCIGLIKGYIWSETPESVPVYAAGCPDYDADGMLAACKERGAIGTIPELPGVLVFYPGHVGVYIGNGEVIEARGHAYGVVKTKLAGRGWKNWGKCPYINYEEEDEMTGKEIYEALNAYLVSLGTSEFAKESSKKGVKTGIFSDGDKDGLLDNPKGFLKREELAVVLNRLGLLDK